MARLQDRLETNQEGDFFVDSSCINCGTCRWMAPSVFDQRGGHSRVHRQPDPLEREQALRALVACPVAAIGTRQTHNVAKIASSFPVPIGPDTYHCGFHHADSYGAASYLIVRPEGNVLVDSPRFTAPLRKGIEALGGVRSMFLTHRDDVADHARFAAHFGCERILHRDDVTASTRDVEIQPQGQAPIRLADDLVVIPVPGHTRGSACLLYKESVLFTGDHLAWSLPMQHLSAFRSACWYDWTVQVQSMTRLLDHRFEHVLPGHGSPCHFDKDEMQRQLEKCITRMRTD